LAPSDGVLLDPFCGSGTVLVEGQFSNLRVLGADSNPLARLIATAKLTQVDLIASARELDAVMSSAPILAPNVPDVINRAHWFSDKVSDRLGRLRAAILAVVDPTRRPFFDMCFSVTVRRVSFADPRLSVPVRINPDRADNYGAKGEEVLRKYRLLEKADVLKCFWAVASANLRRAGEAQQHITRREKFEIFDNAMHLPLPDESVDLVVTSPPYVGAQKYVRASSLCLGWLGMTPQAKLRPLERLSIGREHLDLSEGLSSEIVVPAADDIIRKVSTVNTTRARIAQRYLIEMRQAVSEIARLLKSGGHLVLVVGPNLVSGQVFDTPAYIEELCADAGLTTKVHLIDTIRSRGLMTKRNRTAGLIAQESVFLMQKCHQHAA
jgi:DNA modification methylase